MCIFALAFGKQVAMTDALHRWGDCYLRSILEPTRFSDGDEGIPLCGRKR